MTLSYKLYLNQFILYLYPVQIGYENEESHKVNEKGRLAFAVNS